MSLLFVAVLMLKFKEDVLLYTFPFRFAVEFAFAVAS